MLSGSRMSRDPSAKWHALAGLGLLLAACSNQPRGACDASPQPGKLGTICGVANPEDVEAVPSAGILVVSEMRFPGRPGGGSLAALTLDRVGKGEAKPRRLWPPQDTGKAIVGKLDGDPSCTAPPASLSPHGITSAPAAAGKVRLAVVGHETREAIELFDLEGRGDDARLLWRGCVPLPPETSGNDVAIAPDGEIVVSNYAPDPPMRVSFRALTVMLAAVLFGRPTGDVMVWKPSNGWRHVEGSKASLPNGVAVSRDGVTLYFAETATGRVHRLPFHEGGAGKVESLTIPGKPDNLAWTERGTLLVGTHLSAGAMARCAVGADPCRSPWGLYEIDPQAWTAREVFRHDGHALGAVASATEFGDWLFFGAVYGDRIGVLRVRGS